MAQALRRRPAIELRPQHARIAQFLGFRCAPGETPPCDRCRALAGWSSVLVLRVSRVDAARKGPLDGTVEQPRADPAADIGERQAEEDEFVAVPVRSSRPGRRRAGRHAVHARAGRAARQGGIGQQPALVPEPGTADAIIELAIEGGGRRRDRARSTRRYRARSPRRVQSARTISRCVIVIGSRPSARGGG